jgi:hypothetical protein
MPNPARTGKMAQLILSLATTPDRAASTVGDLIEESDTRGSLWFWSSVLRTACSLCWRDFCSAPLRMIWLGLWGFVATLEVTFITLFVGSAILAGVPNPVPLWFWALEAISCAVASALAGWEVAKRSKGRELAAAFSVALLFAALYGWRHDRPASSGSPEALALLALIPPPFVIAAAILFRFRGPTSPRSSLRAGSPPADPGTARHP